jgi:predicted DNA-binding ribbon-helix-helix protein
MVARNVTIAGRRTSLRIAPEMWDALQEGGHSMTAAIRVYLLTYFRAAATEAGHRAAGHGTLKRKPAS